MLSQSHYDLITIIYCDIDKKCINFAQFFSKLII